MSISGWGRRGDTAIVAVSPEAKLGAAWYRFWTKANHSYGYVCDDIPELAIGVVPDCRGRGIGRQLLRGLMVEASRQGIPALSLSVELDNPAKNLYLSEGFEVTDTIGNAWTMVKRLD